jgi:hypothetical protein
MYEKPIFHFMCNVLLLTYQFPCITIHVPYENISLCMHKYQWFIKNCQRIFFVRKTWSVCFVCSNILVLMVWSIIFSCIYNYSSTILLFMSVNGHRWESCTEPLWFKKKPDILKASLFCCKTLAIGLGQKRIHVCLFPVTLSTLNTPPTLFFPFWGELGRPSFWFWTISIWICKQS